MTADDDLADHVRKQHPHGTFADILTVEERFWTLISALINLVRQEAVVEHFTHLDSPASEHILVADIS